MRDLLRDLDMLARVHLAARRAGFAVVAVYASAELCELVAFAGLDGVLRVEVQREAVEREERLGVEEERALDDPAR